MTCGPIIYISALRIVVTMVFVSMHSATVTLDTTELTASTPPVLDLFACMTITMCSTVRIAAMMDMHIIMTMKRFTCQEFENCLAGLKIWKMEFLLAIQMEFAMAMVHANVPHPSLETTVA